ncbi:MAG: hypothetical protein ACJ8CB_35630 [Ktedonobacteraceae bacterium]
MGLTEVALCAGIERPADRESATDNQSTQADSDAPTHPSRDEARDDDDVARVLGYGLGYCPALVRQVRDVVLRMRYGHAQRNAE